MDKEKERPDAGLRSLDHYKIKLPKWRYAFRERLLPIVRWETPYVAWFQNSLRTPALDTYFATSANLGTHTAFMVLLPILFWCGHTSLGRGMTQVLAAGVFWSGFVKDMLCLPRPLSPPLQRITMSGSAALEYGFPSTHSTNAVSVAVYALYLLRNVKEQMHPNIHLGLQVVCYCYAFSIVLGRLYCGMHGFFDVIWGSVLGILLALVQCFYGEWFDEWLHTGTLQRIVIVVLVVLVLVRVHPEPADDCPCFDDSVSFAGVFMGVQYAVWHFARTSYAWSEPAQGTVPFDLARMGWVVVIARILLGVIMIFAWRGISKPTLLRILPPIFRVIEELGLTLPRRFFKPASEYETVPRQENDDNVIPPARDIPHLLSNLRRRRAISVGPQSEADAYEALAYRDKRRRDSTNPHGAPSPVKEALSEPSYFQEGKSDQKASLEGRKRSSSLEMFRAQMGTGMEGLSPMPLSTPGPQEQQAMDLLQERRLFASIQRPRVRYDVEVITRLIVYSGIGWLAAEGNPILFQLVGLGLN
ncbi:Long-chain base-1-phosphate phosphatase [Elasticomyces elasticus]|uniref:Long-chain base-1-phosphate phosphatase n=1 Tax=Exophiala sideris TaxID=1016849 RepID=A0ABR0JMA4_9EURO|nr:Long-chain base-1-phosphate phosphatase [Elasticomyces elasticus]KAK5036694.1 Long-chain base-1-phosphate phosphatase [Exophiala sideris]KAK5041480.1 Long-chain base-1-phosphate phosphatase [Exophiala sideris]KAK5067078.1 Long-chain base-1-phosphate phosphatase [Exophiala sideris]KAK5185136.1 Long-chain base-1-phosphate phosphatase [Eurotiomycetes sp. CCFEE 6388]